MSGFKIFFGSPPIQSEALTIRGIGVQEHMPPSIVNRPCGTGDHLLMFFYDSVWIGASGDAALHGPGTLMIWTPGRTQYYGNREHPYNHTWVHCNGTWIRSLFSRNRLPRNTPVRLCDPSMLERSLLEIHAELTCYARPNRKMVCNLMENAVIALARALRPEDAASTVPSAMLAVRQLIETDHAMLITLPDLAARANMSVSHFCSEFKKYFGAAPIEYLIHHRMQRAADLLHDREVSISEAGRKVGYDDLFHFSKLFKKHFGVSPRSWRQGHDFPSKQKGHA